jgi:hypothetical protein
MPSPQISQVPTRIGCIAEMHSEQTGSREIFTRGAPQRRQSEGKREANRPCATIAAPETAECSRFRPGGAGVRVMSPVLLKTSLPRPAPGQAPAGRIPLSIAGSRKPCNCSSRCRALYVRPVCAVAQADEHRHAGSEKTVCATRWSQQEYGEEVLLQKGAAPRAVRVRTAAVRTLILP